MTMVDFWKKWRAEILRGSVIFVVVVGLGLTVVSFVHKMEGKAATGMRGFIPQLAESFSSGLGGGFDDPGRNHGATWTWHSKLNAGQTLTLRDINGPIEVTAAPGTETVVTAERSWLTSDPNSVTIEAVPTSSGTMVCAVWPGARGNECSAGGDVNVHMNGRQHNDVAVKFVVQLATGVKLDAVSINGDVDVAGAAAAVSASTVNGDLSVETSSWPVKLSTISGDISATTGAPGTEGAEVHSVSGDVTLNLPEHANLVVNAHTVSGDISDAFDLPVNEGKFGSSHTLSGTIGSGGASLSINTVSGDVSLDKATGSVVRIVKGKKAGVTVVNATPAPAVAPAPPAKP
jgi:hypothetical protein